MALSSACPLELVQLVSMPSPPLAGHYLTINCTENLLGVQNSGDIGETSDQESPHGRIEPG